MKSYKNEYEIIRFVYIFIINHVTFILAVRAILHIFFFSTAYAEIKRRGKSENYTNQNKIT